MYSRAANKNKNKNKNIVSIIFIGAIFLTLTFFLWLLFFSSSPPTSSPHNTPSTFSLTSNTQKVDQYPKQNTNDKEFDDSLMKGPPSFSSTPMGETLDKKIDKKILEKYRIQQEYLENYLQSLRLDVDIQKVNTESVVRKYKDEIREKSKEANTLAKKNEELSLKIKELEGKIKIMNIQAQQIHNQETSRDTISFSESVQKITSSETKEVNLTLLKQLFDLANSNPIEFIQYMTTEDPLNIEVESPNDFKCPPQSSTKLNFLGNYDASNQEIKEKYHRFQKKEKNSFIFFQHMRKAGGTGFCDLAQRNMPGEVPHYYCMPDNRGSLMTPPWNTTWLIDICRQYRYRIAANEWDALTESKITELNTRTNNGVIFSTMLRDPLDRWLSQYRFEHVEKRDNGKGDLDFATWYNREKSNNMGSNYYVKTFIGEENEADQILLEKTGPKGIPLVHGNFYWTYQKYRHDTLTWYDFEKATKNLINWMDIVLILEWIDFTKDYVEELLDWREAPRQVLPHENQSKRSNKTSRKAKDTLPPLTYDHLVKDNIFDILFFAISKRILLERMAKCL